jgi:uncharacterized membrane protein HdeD (DUF308 family)
MISEVPAIRHNWWLFVLLGVVCLATGVAALVWPDITLLAFGIILGIYLMIGALLEIIDAVTGDPGGRAISAILAVITLLAGLICVRRPGESLVVLAVALSLYLVAAGVFRIVRAFSADALRWWGVGLGLVEVVVGIVVLASPHIALGTLVVVFSLDMLFRGVVSIVAGIMLRSLKDEDTSPVEQTASFA